MKPKPMKATQLWVVTDAQLSRSCYPCQIFQLRREAIQYLANRPHLAKSLRIARVLVTEIEKGTR